MTTVTRKERSSLRAAEHQRGLRLRSTIMFSALAIYVLVPLLWYGAVEFGLVHPIRTSEFNNALHFAGSTLFLVFILLFSDFYRRMRSREQEEDPKEEQHPPAA